MTIYEMMEREDTEDVEDSEEFEDGYGEDEGDFD